MTVPCVCIDRYISNLPILHQVCFPATCAWELVVHRSGCYLFWRHTEDRDGRAALSSPMMDNLCVWVRVLNGLLNWHFVTRFPSYISATLQQLPGAGNLEMSDLLVSARVLAVNRIYELDVVVTTKRNPVNPGKFSSQCKRPHMIRDCKAPPQQDPISYRYGESGHIAWYCCQGKGD